MGRDMDVFWLEQTEADVPAGNDWLTANEAAHLAGLRIDKRRADWRLGRWTAKRALALCFNLQSGAPELSVIEIRAAPGGAPEALLGSELAPVTISISHRANRAVCAVAESGAKLGSDLELVEPRSFAFVADYYTVEEQAYIARAPAPDRARLVTLFWSAKESALKALGEGLRLDTRSVIVSVENAFRGQSIQNPWSALRVRSTDGAIFQGWWQVCGTLVRTVVAVPAPGPPILLGVGGHSSVAPMDD